MISLILKEKKNLISETNWTIKDLSEKKKIISCPFILNSIFKASLFVLQVVSHSEIALTHKYYLGTLWADLLSENQAGQKRKAWLWH